MSERNPASHMDIRSYRSEDAQGTLAVFLAAVTVTASADYSREQIAAWARPDRRNVADWNRGMADRNTYVAVVDEEVVGFSDVNVDGYIDMMFVSPRYARQGIAHSLLKLLETHARDLGARRLSADVSITARPFFECHGFNVGAEQHPVMAGVQMTNFRMTKRLREFR